MTPTNLGTRFFETTRGRIVALLRRGPRTVDELAAAVETTDNAVRAHLVALERDSFIRQSGVRKGAGAGKPALVYELHPDAELIFSKAYPPVLAAVVDALLEELPAARATAIMRKVGRRLAASLGRDDTATTLEARAAVAAAALTALGGEVEVVSERRGALTLRASGCPLSAAVAIRPELCRAVEALVADVAGVRARECCDHTGRPRCCFELSAAS